MFWFAACQSVGNADKTGFQNEKIGKSMCYATAANFVLVSTSMHQRINNDSDDDLNYASDILNVVMRLVRHTFPADLCGINLH